MPIIWKKKFTPDYSICKLNNIWQISGFYFSNNMKYWLKKNLKRSTKIVQTMFFQRNLSSTKDKISRYFGTKDTQLDGFDLKWWFVIRGLDLIASRAVLESYWKLELAKGKRRPQFRWKIGIGEKLVWAWNGRFKDTLRFARKFWHVSRCHPSIKMKIGMNKKSCKGRNCGLKNKLKTLKTKDWQ